MNLLRHVITAAAFFLASASALAASTVTYFHNDLTGSPVAATNEAGAVIWREGYRPFGERLQAPATDNQVWFTSRRQDPETGLVYMGARYYDPVAGRFLSPDPVHFVEGNIHSFNRYAYANNNPYAYVDPDGRAPVLVPLIAAAVRWAGQRVLTFALTRGAQGSVTAAEIGAGEALGAGGVAAGAVVGSKALSKAGESTVDAGMIYRAGGGSPSNLKTRAGEDAVSFRDSLSNPIESAARPVMRPGDPYIGVDVSMLPPGSVIRDNVPVGHVSVQATPEQIKGAIVERGKFPKD
jgi:RHS repeat-associated protein